MSGTNEMKENTCMFDQENHALIQLIESKENLEEREGSVTIVAYHPKAFGAIVAHVTFVLRQPSVEEDPDRLKDKYGHQLQMILEVECLATGREKSRLPVEWVFGDFQGTEIYDLVSSKYSSLEEVTKVRVSYGLCKALDNLAMQSMIDELLDESTEGSSDR